MSLPLRACPLGDHPQGQVDSSRSDCGSGRTDCPGSRVSPSVRGPSAVLPTWCRSNWFLHRCCAPCNCRAISFVDARDGAARTDTGGRSGTAPGGRGCRGTVPPVPWPCAVRSDVLLRSLTGRAATAGRLCLKRAWDVLWRVESPARPRAARHCNLRRRVGAPPGGGSAASSTHGSSSTGVAAYTVGAHSGRSPRHRTASVPPELLLPDLSPAHVR